MILTILFYNYKNFYKALTIIIVSLRTNMMAYMS